jgi:hypothetical protein
MTTIHRTLHCAALLAGAALACRTPEGGDSATATAAETSATGEPTETGGGPMFRGACPLADRVGGFVLAMEPDYTAFSGAVADGVVPSTVLEPVGEGDGCTLLRRNNPFCDPPCQPGTTCDFDGACIAYPANHSVGTLALTGLTHGEVTVEPVMPTFDYFSTELMHPAFAPGAAIGIEASGGDYSAFTLHGEGVAMIEPDAEALEMRKDQPLTITWAASEGAGQVRVELNIDQHGLTPVKLICEVEDTGTLTIPAALISQLIAFGISGFPSVQYYRQTVDSIDLEPGCVEFAVRSHRQTLLSVEGHIPCNKPADCPDGQVCDLPTQTCK